MNELVVCAIGFFVLVQLLNGIVNILTTNQLKRISQAQAELRATENELQAEQWESVIIKFSDIIEKLNTQEDRQQLHFEELMDILERIPPPPKETRKRGPYKPRKPKELVHKKTLPEDQEG